MAGRAPDAAYGPHRCSRESYADQQFVAMLNGYRGLNVRYRTDEGLFVVLYRKCEATWRTACTGRGVREPVRRLHYLFQRQVRHD